jgi:hypothetical protein
MQNQLESKENLINIARHYSIKPSEFLSTFTRIEKEEHDKEKSLF